MAAEAVVAVLAAVAASIAVTWEVREISGAGQEFAESNTGSKASINSEGFHLGVFGKEQVL